MKIRNGFVSNSSSSSFVIAFKKTEPCPHCKRKDPDIIQIISDSGNYSDDNRVNGVGIENIIAKINEDDWMKDEDKKERVEYCLSKCKPYDPKDGWVIADISVSHHDETIKGIMSSMQDAGSLVIID